MWMKYHYGFGTPVKEARPEGRLEQRCTGRMQEGGAGFHPNTTVPH